jgi:hypothetical protein
VLSPESRAALRLSTVTVELGADSPCLGNAASLWLMRNLVGYETALTNAMVAATRGRGFFLAEERERGGGFGLGSGRVWRGGGGAGGASAGSGAGAGGGSGLSRDHGHGAGAVHSLAHASAVTHFSHAWAPFLFLRLGTLCSAVFLVFSASSLTSFIIGQTQQRMLVFTVALQLRLRARRRVLPLIAAHLADSLVFVPMLLGLKLYKHLYGFPLPQYNFVVPEEPQWPYWMAGMPLGEWAAACRVQQKLVEQHYPDRWSMLNALEFLWWIPPVGIHSEKFSKPL